ncbi:MAG: glycosyltransferase [Myxococcales bacterium]|nr:glycosyltransferase [Myxococcales bacterium]
MRVCFVHPAYPGQFELPARWLAAERGWDVCFLTTTRRGRDGAFRVYAYQPDLVPSDATGATAAFAEDDAHGLAAARTLRGMLEAGERFDLVVCHSGFGVGRYLREVFDGPVVGLFEWYFDPETTRVPVRPATAWTARRRIASYGKNAGVLLDLVGVDAAWTSTPNQRASLPAGLRDRVQVIPDAYDPTLWCPGPADDRRVGSLELPTEVPIVSFCSRGLEATRGYDVFLEVAAKVQQARPDVLFVTVGDDVHLYGPQTHRASGHATFREEQLARFPGDASRIWHTPSVPAPELVRLLRATTVHTYLSDPFVLSWSPRDAMACGALLVAADHAATRDLVTLGVTGRTAPLTDIDALAAQVLEGLEPTAENDGIRRRAAAEVRERYAVDVVGPALEAFLSTCRGS